MRHITRLLCAAQLVCLVGIAPVRGQQPVKTSGDKGAWTIKWSASDEFNSNVMDWRKWIKTAGLPDTNSWLWDNANNAAVVNGTVRLTMRHNPNNVAVKNTYFQSAILKSYKTFTYGYFESRMRAAAFPGSGVCSSFWLFSDFDDEVAEGQTIYSEIDVVELQQFDWHNEKQDDARDIDLNLHCVVRESGKRAWRRPKTHPQGQLNKWRAPWDPRDDFHIYGCEVNRSEIIWFVDGKEVARKPNTHWHRPKHIAMSLGLRKPFVQFEENRNNPSDPATVPDARNKLPDLPTSMVIDYVRVWEKTIGSR
ncbi:MAG: family 16 glycosylhydrolase [Planctomycetaceae bacterium]